MNNTYQEDQGATTCIALAGHSLVLDAEGIIYWPAKDLLVVSDLHLESDFSFIHTNTLSLFSTQTIFERLQQLISHYQPRHIACLGSEMPHLNYGDAVDLPMDAIKQLCTEGNIRWHWIVSQPETQNTELLFGEIKQQLHVENLLISHEPSIHYLQQKHPQIVGHFHPKTTHTIDQQTISGKCFLQTDHCLLMPAFGAYSGGLDVVHPSIQQLCGEGEQQKLLLYKQRIWALQ